MAFNIAEGEEIYLTAKGYCLTSATWFALATTFGMLAAGYLIAPDFMANIGFLHLKTKAQ